MVKVYIYPSSLFTNKNEILIYYEMSSDKDQDFYMYDLYCRLLQSKTTAHEYLLKNVVLYYLEWIKSTGCSKNA